MSRPSVTACILTFNNEKTIETCLKSIAWVDEIVVVDSLSTDGTLDIVRTYTDKVHQRPWPGNRDQYNYAGGLAASDWILWIDSDEALSPELEEEIRTVLEQEDLSDVGVFSLSEAFVLPGPLDRSRGVVSGSRPAADSKLGAVWEGDDPHPRLKVTGRTVTLKGHIHHWPYKNFSEQIQTVDRYSSAAAAEMHRAGKAFSLFTLLLNPPLRFLREYFLKQGFRDGLPGLIIAGATAFYVFAKYAKLWELKRREPR